MLLSRTVVSLFESLENTKFLVEPYSNHQGHDRCQSQVNTALLQSDFSVSITHNFTGNPVLKFISQVPNDYLKGGRIQGSWMKNQLISDWVSSNV